MKYNTLGRTDLKVSTLCLGSMTWGSQNTLEQGHAQIDAALDAGINFVDTAEMYPTNPVRAEACGRTEEIIGEWFAKTGRRADTILATKITGEGQGAIRDGAPVTAETVRDAIDGSLKRLKTDYIDLYQIHWPNRGSFQFRKNWTFDARNQPREGITENMVDVLQELQRQIDAGRIRHFGLSNESAWGTAKWLRLAEDNGLPRVQSIQNEYNLLCRHFDTDMAELSHHEDVGLLAFSPLAAGLLSGKYASNVTPPGTRRSISENLGGRVSPRVWGAIDAYKEIANSHGLTLVQMSIAWCLTRPFMTAAIIGATNLDQLQEILGVSQLALSNEVLKDISAAHKAHPMPY